MRDIIKLADLKKKQQKGIFYQIMIWYSLQIRLHHIRSWYGKWIKLHKIIN